MENSLKWHVSQPDEAAQVDNLKRTVLIYDLMMGRLIEQHASWPLATDSIAEPARVDQLAETLAAHVKNPPVEIADTLNRALQSGTLAWRVEKGRNRLQWVDTL